MENKTKEKNKMLKNCKHNWEIIGFRDKYDYGDRGISVTDRHKKTTKYRCEKCNEIFII